MDEDSTIADNLQLTTDNYIMQFSYEATRKDGKTEKGTRDAENAEEVGLWLQAKALQPVSIVAGKSAKKKSALSISIGSSFTIADQIFFLKHLSTMLAAGLHLAESIDILHEEATRPFLKKLLREAKENIERGLPLSALLKAHPKQFSPVFIGVIEAGEASGTLEKSLEQLLVQVTKDHELMRKVKSAMAYPAILLFASLTIVTALVTLVLPRLQKMFQSLNVPLPAITRALLFVSNVLTAYPLLTVSIVVILVVLFITAVTTPRGKRFLGLFSLRVPILRVLVKRIVIARMLRILGTLLESGLSITDAVKLAAVSAGNSAYQIVLEKSVGDIERGIGLSSSLEQYPQLFPRLVTSMMAIGERTGSLTNLLGNMASFYEEETDQALKSALGALEPILLAFMGLVVGGVAISILLPIYKIVGSVGG